MSEETMIARLNELEEGVARVALALERMTGTSQIEADLSVADGFVFDRGTEKQGSSGHG